MNQLNKEKGLKAEYYVIDKLQEREIEVDHTDDWYDIEANKTKIEIKSALLSVKQPNHKKTSYRSGRFDFTNEENRDKIWGQNIWLCLVARWRSEFMILGFIQAKKFKKKRYIPISTLRSKTLLTIDEFVKQIR